MTGKKNAKVTVKKIEKELKNVEKAVLSGRRRRRGGGGGGGGNAYVSEAATIKSSASQRLRVHGTDRYVHIPNCVGKKEGSVLFNAEVSAESFARLKHISEAYQRYHFKKLVFRIVPMASTDFSGGYAAAFIADASDDIGSGGDALNRIVAQTGAKITKIWQSAVVSHRCLPDLLYTSEPPGGDIRLHSPGRLVVAVDSEISGATDRIKVPMTIYCDWEADLYESCLEGPHAKVSGQIVVSKPFYSRSEKVGLFDKDDMVTAETSIPGITVNEEYTVSHDVFLRFETEGGNYSKLKYEYNSTEKRYVLYVVGHDGKKLSQKTDVNYWALQAGDRLTPVAKNVTVGEEYLCLKKTEASSSTPEIPPEGLDTVTSEMEGFTLV